MSDQEQQYQWALTKGFHKKLIPAMIIGAVVVSVLIIGCVAQFGHLIGLTSFRSMLILDLAVGLPVGAYFGYLAGLGAMKKRLEWVKWGEAHGWEYQAKPKQIGAGLSAGEEGLRKSSIFWHHARKHDLIHRRIGDQGISLLRATNFTKRTPGSGQNDLVGGTRKQSGGCFFLVMDNPISCPPMNIHSRKFIDRLHLPTSRPVVSFEVNDFNEKWTVHASDAKAAYARISQKVIDFLLSSSDKYLIEFVDDMLIVQYWISQTEEFLSIRNPRQFYMSLMTFTEEFIDNVPEDLMKSIHLVDKIA